MARDLIGKMIDAMKLGSWIKKNCFSIRIHVFAKCLFFFLFFLYIFF